MVKTKNDKKNNDKNKINDKKSSDEKGNDIAEYCKDVKMANIIGVYKF